MPKCEGLSLRHERTKSVPQTFTFSCPAAQRYNCEEKYF